MDKTKEVFGAVSFFIVLIVLSPLLLAWYALDKICGRDFWADLNDEDYYE